MAFTDFPSGLSGVGDYLNAQHHIRADLQGSVADIGRFVISAEYSAELKEIICSLLAGRGLKLPNIQLCLFINLQELLRIPQLQSALFDALNTLANAFERFLDHTKIDQVLGRINNALAEATNIANMINFCSAPIDPVAIPNILEQSMQTFLGAGKDIIDKIGQLVPEEIGGCLIDGELNCNVFSGGVLGRICDNYADVALGNASVSFIEAITADVNAIVSQIDQLIDLENSITGTYKKGGSDFEDPGGPLNTGMGVLLGPDETITSVTGYAQRLKALYDNLGSYQVIGNDGTVYNNIFETFVEPGLLNLLRRSEDPTPKVADRQPVFNYCGEIVGYTESVIQSQAETSQGKLPEPDYDEPGYLAGGLPTNPTAEAQDVAEAGGGSVTNNITNVTNIQGSPGVTFVGSEAAQLSLELETGALVYRSDQGITYAKNSGETGTMSDFTIIAGDASVANEINSTVTTTDNAVTQVLSNIGPVSGNAWFVDVQATAKRTDLAGEVISIRIEAIVDNSGGVRSIAGSGGSKTVFASSPTTTGYDLVLGTNGGTDFTVSVQGATGHNVKWAVRVKFHQV